MASVSKSDEQFRNYALNAPPLRVLLTVCTPLMLYQAMSTVFKLLDSLLAAQISSGAASAVSAMSQITLMINAVGSGLAIGGSIQISEAYGRGDYDRVQHLTSTLYAMATLVGVAVVLLLVPFAPAFLGLMGTPQELIQTGTGYFRVEILSLVASFFNTVYIAIERSRGHSRKILALNMVIFVVKLSLSALFVYVLREGVIMIAVATLASQLALLVYALATMPFTEGAFRFSMKKVRFRRDTVLSILNLAYPVSAEKVLFQAGKVTVNAMSGSYGPLTVGALGISNNIGGLTTSLHVGLSDGATSLISQNRGAGRYRRTLQMYAWLVAAEMGIGVIGLACVSQTLPWLARIFAQSRETFDQSFCDMIVDIHRWEMLGYITLGLNSATLALLLGYGYTKLTLVLNIARVFVFRVPVLWFLQHFTGLGAEAVGVTMMVSNVCAGLSAILAAIPVLIKIRRLAKEEENCPHGDCG